jgi:hypothetical protein
VYSVFETHPACVTELSCCSLSCRGNWGSSSLLLSCLAIWGSRTQAGLSVQAPTIVSPVVCIY